MMSIYVASVLHVFAISAGVDELGNPVKLSADLDGGMVSYVMVVLWVFPYR